MSPYRERYHRELEELKVDAENLPCLPLARELPAVGTPAFTLNSTAWAKSTAWVAVIVLTSHGT